MAAERKLHLSEQDKSILLSLSQQGFLEQAQELEIEQGHYKHLGAVQFQVKLDNGQVITVRYLLGRQEQPIEKRFLLGHMDSQGHFQVILGLLLKDMPFYDPNWELAHRAREPSMKGDRLIEQALGPVLEIAGPLEALAHMPAGSSALALAAFWDNGGEKPAVAQMPTNAPASSKTESVKKEDPQAKDRDDFRRSLLRSLNAKDHKLLAQLVQDLENPNREIVRNILERFEAKEGQEKERDEYLKTLFLAFLSTNPEKFLNEIKAFRSQVHAMDFYLTNYISNILSKTPNLHDFLAFIYHYGEGKQNSSALEDYLSWARSLAMPALKENRFYPHSALALAGVGKWLGDKPFKLKDHLYLDKDGYLAIQWKDEKGKDIQDQIYKQFLEDIKNADGYYAGNEIDGMTFVRIHMSQRLTRFLPILFPKRRYDPKDPNMAATAEFILKIHQQIQHGTRYAYVWTEDINRVMDLYEKQLAVAESLSKKQELLARQLQFMRQSPVMLDRYLRNITQAIGQLDVQTAFKLAPPVFDEIIERYAGNYDLIPAREAIVALLKKSPPHLAAQFFKQFSEKIKSWDDKKGRNRYALVVQILWEKVLTKKPPQSAAPSLYPDIDFVSANNFNEILKANPEIRKQFFIVFGELIDRWEGDLNSPNSSRENDARFFDLEYVPQLIAAVASSPNTPVDLRLEMLRHANNFIVALHPKNAYEQAQGALVRTQMLPALADIYVDKALAGSQRLKALDFIRDFLSKADNKDPRDIVNLSQTLAKILPTLYEEIAPGTGKRPSDSYMKNKSSYLIFNQTVLRFIWDTGRQPQDLFKKLEFSPIEAQLNILQDLIEEGQNLQTYTSVLIPILRRQEKLSQAEKTALQQTLRQLDKKDKFLFQKIQERAKKS